MFHCIPRAGNIASVFYYSAVIARAEQNLMTQLMQLILKKIVVSRLYYMELFMLCNQIELLEGRKLIYSTRF